MDRIPKYIPSRDRVVRLDRCRGKALFEYVAFSRIQVMIVLLRFWMRWPRAPLTGLNRIRD